jgi:hypothetical protein
MENESKRISRKKILKWAVGITSLLAIPAFLNFSGKKRTDSKSVKMLTQDGRLVEIDAANIPLKRKKIKEAEIHSWINKKTSL